jgi:hypothetical protein
MIRMVWGKDQVPIYIRAYMAHFKGLVLLLNGKNQRQWGATCNIGQPSHCHVHGH